MFSAVARYLAVVALAVWTGSLVFFGAVLAPTAFKLMPSPHDAGMLVGAALQHLHIIGLGCGLVAVLCLLAAGWGRLGKTAAAIVLVLVMMGLTEASQYAVLPQMERDRATARADISSLAWDDAKRADFDKLHDWSEWIEEAVLACGLAALAFALMPPGDAEDVPVE